MKQRLLPLVALMAALAAPAYAQTSSAAAAGTEEQQPAVLVADSLFITPDRQLIAEGNVEAYQGTTRLRAKRITYDDTTGEMKIDGPIRIDEGPDMTILADAAQMDRGLQDGLLQGARMVIQQQLQLAALQMTRVGGRYTQLYKTAVTSCHVCENGRPPLWQIRAHKITHDQLEKQLYFENATFRILDVPVFYFPAMRLPDPSLKRATGFLIPSIRTTTQLSTGVKIPYFFKLADDKDLTLTPYLSTRTNTLGYRYRQAFKRGYIEFEGAHTRDDLQPGQTRGYLFGFGGFDLGNSFQLNFDIKTASDNAYLADYGLPDLDRLRSTVSLSRIRRDTAFHTALVHYDSLRDFENEDLIPTRIGDVFYQKRFHPPKIGGELRMSFNAHGHYRGSDLDVLGRDVNRMTADIDWRRSWFLRGGIRADWEMGVSTDWFHIKHDSNYSREINHTTPRAALRFSYPMTRRVSGGIVQYLEPVVQLGWSDVHGTTVPNDESRFVEFDQGNLLALSRFPANDRREDGAQAVVGLNWARYGTDGWQTYATIGQVFRSHENPDFSHTSGLQGTSSDLLLAGQVRYNDKLSVTVRGLMDWGFDFSKAELRGDWRGDRTTLSTSYIWLGIDPQESRPKETSEIWFDGSYIFNPNWTARANLRYDISDDLATRAGVGLIYRNECVTVDLSLNRRFTSSSSVEPSTDFGFTISLNGFSVESETEKYRRSCKKS